MLPEAITVNSSHLINIFDIYGLSQLITEPTRVTPDSKTLIDLCITNSPEKVTNSGVIHLGISDHSLVFLSRKTQYCRIGPRVIETRQFKHFNRGKFLSDLNQLPWANVDLYSDPNEMWRVWKEMFLGCVDKHAPLKSKRIRNKRSPWITRELLSKIRKRDFQSSPITRLFGINLGVQETRQITQLNSQRNSFLKTWKPTKVICAKHGMLSTS